MLILTRTLDKSEIVIGQHGEVVVKILGVSGKQIKVGIEAPKCIPVHRSEIIDRIKSDSKEGKK